MPARAQRHGTSYAGVVSHEYGKWTGGNRVGGCLSVLVVQNMDGKRGSMCTDTERFKGNKVGCDPPLACEAMIGPMLHSGYGYCTDLSIGKFGMTGAMRAAKVAQRRSCHRRSLPPAPRLQVRSPASSSACSALPEQSCARQTCSLLGCWDSYCGFIT